MLRQRSSPASPLDTHPKVDVIIVGRGGGSMEDLWAFNEKLLLEPLPIRIRQLSCSGS